MELMRAMQWSTHGKTLFITTLKGITEAYHQTLEVSWHHTALSTTYIWLEAPI